MNYKLAKQLKDAGFLQQGHGRDSMPNYWNPYDTERPMVYSPTLSELIDACPKEISKNGLNYRFILFSSTDKGKDSWTAGYIRWDDDGHEWKMAEFSKVSEEAVAKLRLKLKGRDK